MVWRLQSAAEKNMAKKNVPFNVQRQEVTALMAVIAKGPFTAAMERFILKRGLGEIFTGQAVINSGKAAIIIFA